MIAASYLLGLDGKNARRIYKRDHKNHSSPNSARTESVCAGALGVQLAGDAFYFGKLVQKPTIGDPGRPVTAEDIRAILPIDDLHFRIEPVLVFQPMRLTGVLIMVKKSADGGDVSTGAGTPGGSRAGGFFGEP